MTESEIIEGNKLIAEVMRRPYQNPRELMYHLSWDLLMGAVQKILSQDIGMNVYQLYISDSLRTADIKEVWESVVDFIKWYNNQNK